MADYIVLMQVRLTSSPIIVQDTIRSLKISCSSFFPIARTDDDSRVDTYIFDSKQSPEQIKKIFKKKFIGAIEIVSFKPKSNLEYQLVKTASIISKEFLTHPKRMEHIRRHLLHYIFNSWGLNYLDEMKLYIEFAQSMGNSQNLNLKNVKIIDAR